jgi:hypothetical protein
VFTGVIRTDHPNPVVIKRGDGIDIGGLDIRSESPADRGYTGALRRFLLRVITVFT